MRACFFCFIHYPPLKTNSEFTPEKSVGLEDDRFSFLGASWTYVLQVRLLFVRFRVPGSFWKEKQKHTSQNSFLTRSPFHPRHHGLRQTVLGASHCSRSTSHDRKATPKKRGNGTPKVSGVVKFICVFPKNRGGPPQIIH